MKTRTNFIPRAGQVWRSSDPRRLSAFRVVAVDSFNALVHMLTNPGPTGSVERTINLRQFAVLGPKGYMRVS